MLSWCSGSERRFYDDHDRKVNGSTPNLVSLLRPSRWLSILRGIWQAANQRSQKKIQLENLETKATPKRVWIRPIRIAPQPLSRNKMKKSIQSFVLRIITEV